MIVHPLFVQYLAEEKLNLDLDLLEKYSLELESSTKGVIKSNVGGFQSDVISPEDFKYKPYVDTISKKLDELSTFLQLNKKLKLRHMWVNINRNNNYNMSHRHSGTLVSGVFYVKVSPVSGHISFKHPNASTQEMYYHYSGIFDSINYTNISNALEYNVVPENNLLIIFPGWLNHEVEPNLSSNDIRISIGFNAYLPYEDIK